MMLNKIKNLIETSRSFAILTNTDAEEHEILAKEILERVLADKNLPFVSLPQETNPLREKWSAILKPANQCSLLQKTSIKLPKDKCEVKEISYEEDENHLSFIITSPKSGISKEDLILENLPPQVDAVFCFFEDEEKLKGFENKAQLPPLERIVFITPNERTITEKIIDIASLFNPALLNSGGIPTLLFAALIKETNNFTERITKNTLYLASLLLEKGAEKETVLSITDKEKSPFYVQLLGRLLARTYVDDLLNVSWSFINQRDLQKTNATGASPAFLYELIKKTRNFLPPQKLHILIWQSIDGIKALVAAPADKNEKYLLPWSQKLQTVPQSRFFIAGPFTNFSQAEIKLRQILKEEIHNL